MKKFIALFISALMILSLTACKSNEAGSADTATDTSLKVMATIFPQYDFSREIGGDKVDVSLLLPPGSESHSYEPTPQDIIDIEKCDVFIYVGGENEAWVDTILDSVDKNNMTILSLMDIVDAVEEETVEGMQGELEEEDSDGDKHGTEEIEYDEHVWTSPVNAMRISSAIANTFCELDPDNADYYNKNAEDYTYELGELDKSFRDVTENSLRHTIVFGDRFPFRYFADEYGLEYYAAFPGCSTETDASAQTVAFLIDKIKAEQIPVVFHIEFSNERMADTISESTGAKKLLMHSCHNVSPDDMKNGVSYLSLMKANVEVLKEALN